MKTYVKVGEKHILAYDSEAVMDAKGAVIKALKDVLAEIHETGILDHHSDEIEVALAYGKVETIIEQKIAEVKGDKK